MTNEDKKKGLPLWAKVLIGIVIFFSVVGIGGGIAIYSLWQTVASQVGDPMSVPRTAENIGAFPEPLPKGYRYMSGFSLLGMNVLMVMNDKTNLMLSFVSFPMREQNVEELAEMVFKQGLLSGGGGRGKDIKARGKEMLSGAPMAYVMGAVETNKLDNAQAFAACILSKTSNKTIIVYALQPGEKPLSGEAVLEFLRSVKSW